MSGLCSSSDSVQLQLRSFVSFDADDDMAQLILEELSYMRRSFTGVAAEIACSPSSSCSTGLNVISEDGEEDEGA
uniref:Pheromone n=1 Tax=Peronospora matthiolae TaxID=2874970 RepID=A0AAV1UII0_9STRA